ncbi:lipopolysaccharide assembly protein LapA domain-containing protein [Alteromonas confluentis]|uniref:Probable lipopolysaccharide assembly protein A n=1 Tax=Alteromonas confluentis TaxID=1656094 RepID=A0A1E7Z5I8_9ALTE|nr:lipopolysaccharide assembly protein LapA domain-containing protein [Alteromonas confluentis]OFC68654.1 hypothetical protein BFC18_00965 [Alteromonas confluentis]
MKGIITLLVIVFLLVMAFAIGSQNETLVTVNYLIAQSELRMSTLIAVTLSIGILIGLLMMLLSWLSLRVQLVAVRGRLRKATKE